MFQAKWFLLLPCLVFGLQLQAQVPALEAAVAAYRDSDFELANMLLRDALPRYTLTSHPDSNAFIHLYLAEVAYELDDPQCAPLFVEAEERLLNNFENPSRFDFYYRILQGRAATSNEEEEERYTDLALAEVYNHQQGKPEAMADALHWEANRLYYAGYTDSATYLLDSAYYYAVDGVYCPRDMGQLYANLSTLYFLQGDGERALINQQLATQLAEKPSERCLNLSHEGEALTDLRRFAAAGRRFEEAAEICRANGITDDSWRDLLCNRMLYHYHLENWAAYDENHEALGASLSALEDPYESYQYGRYFIYGASKALTINDFSSAAQWLADYARNGADGQFADTDFSYRWLKTKLLAGQGQLAEATHLLTKLIRDFEWGMPAENIAEWNANQFEPSRQSIIWVKDLAAYYLRWFAAAPQSELLEKADFLLKFCDELLLKARQINYQYANRLLLNETALEIAKLRMAVIRTKFLNDPRPALAMQALNTSADVKQLWVSDRYFDELLRDDLELSPELIRREERLDRELREHLRSLEGEGGQLSTADIAFIRTSVDSLREEQLSLKTEFQEKVPAYLAQRYATPDIQLADIRSELLEDNEVLLQFLEVDTAVYIVIIDQETIEFEFLRLQEPLSQRIPRLVDQLDQKSGGDSLFKELHALYQEIFDPIIDKLGTADLLLVPDGYLWYLPFNALIPSLGPDGGTPMEHRYLIQDRRIRFQLSTQIGLLSGNHGVGKDLPEAPSAVNLSTREVLSLSPMTDDSLAGFLQLPMSGRTSELLADIGGIKPNRLLEGAAASEAVFWKLVSSVGLLHLDTHTRIDQENPDRSFLQLYPAGEHDGRLYAYELAEMDADISLAVLLACHSADGRLFKGQGVANLGRDMMRGGAKSLVVNLWRISEDMSSRLVERFYPALLAEGQRPADALRAAQLAQLEMSMTAHPADWATPLFMGLNEPIKLESQGANWWRLGLVGLLTLLLLAVIRQLRTYGWAFNRSAQSS